MGLSCGAAKRQSLAAIGGHASEADRLDLEGHLAVCAACASDHRALALVRRLKKTQPDPLLGAARERIRQNILAQRSPSLRAPRRVTRPFALTAVFAAAAVVVLWQALPLVGVGAPEQVTGGDVSRALGFRDWWRGAVTFRTRWGGQVTLGDAIITLAADSEVAWHRSARTLMLHRGEVTVDVEHRAGQHFQVDTPRFRVDVVGTRFTVDLVSVRTYRGAVRVVRSNGQDAGLVTAGAVWNVDAEQIASMDVADVPVTSSDGALASSASSASPSSSSGPSSPSGSSSLRARSGQVQVQVQVQVDDGAAADSVPGAPEGWPLVRLSRARRWLARGEADNARRVLLPVFKRERRFAVEARALYAESFLVQGRYGQAIHAYGVVARDFPATPQAESALFAVAQLQSEHGRPADAKKSLERYLSQYPKGRFVKEATERLASMRTLVQ